MRKIDIATLWVMMIDTVYQDSDDRKCGLLTPKD